MRRSLVLPCFGGTNWHGEFTSPLKSCCDARNPYASDVSRLGASGRRSAHANRAIETHVVGIERGQRHQ
jgi:hypothetical protein